MASPHEVPVTLGNGAFTDENENATLGSALERVLEAQQDLVIRRAGLRIEELVAQISSSVSDSLVAALGYAIAFAGWFIAMVGLVDALDRYFARFAVEIGLGAIHVAAGFAIVLARRWRSREAT
jgi:uncharacterized membrane-anchored protein